MAIEIPEDAYQFTPCGPLGSKISVGNQHEHIGEFVEMDDALAAVKAKMDKDQFWPSLVWVSDHGNWWYIDTDGNEIKVETEECPHCGEEFEQGELELHEEYCPDNEETEDEEE